LRYGGRSSPPLAFDGQKGCAILSLFSLPPSCRGAIFPFSSRRSYVQENRFFPRALRAGISFLFSFPPSLYLLRKKQKDLLPLKLASETWLGPRFLLKRSRTFPSLVQKEQALFHLEADSAASSFLFSSSLCVCRLELIVPLSPPLTPHF